MPQPAVQRRPGLEHHPIARIVDQLRAAGHEVRDEDLARVSPLAHAHVIPSGSYFQSPRRGAEAAAEAVMA